MERFEELFESWINGNRKFVRSEANKFSSNDQYKFANWLREQYSHEWIDRKELFEMVLFIAFS